MCGIFGVLDRRGVVGKLEPLFDATNLLAHRGPDDGAYWSEGPFFLGHRRLSIIDLAHGAQPMASHDGRFVVAFNGEIYNYVELRESLLRQGCRFVTDSDTETILEGFRVWGTSVASRLVGMFAFALVDRKAGSLYLARDRFGEKPLFVHEEGGRIAFASETKALASLSFVEQTIDREALAPYLCLNYVPDERTMLAGVHRLAPATWRLYEDGRRREERFWQMPAPDPHASTMGLDEAVEALQERLDAAVRITLRSDVPVALFLSGGIDSSLVAESATRQGRLRHAYCLDFAESGFSEWEGARRVAQALGLELRRAELSAAHLRDFLAIVEHADDPLADSSALAVWALSATVRADYKVAISGDGGDELFGGYLTYQATRLHRRFVARMPASWRRTIARVGRRLPTSSGKVTTSYKLMRFLRAADLPSAVAHYTWNGTWLPKDAARLVRDPALAQTTRRTLDELVRRHGMPSSPGLADLQREDAGNYLPNDILAKVDRMTMAHGLEARAPLLVPGVAEFGLALPEALKLGPKGPPKRVLRALATRRLGPEVGNARKQGFSIPVHRWLRGPARGLAIDLLSAHELERVGLFDVAEVVRVRDAHLAGRVQLGHELWGLMVLVAWHRARVQSRPQPAHRLPLRRIEVALPVHG